LSRKTIIPIRIRAMLLVGLLLGVSICFFVFFAGKMFDQDKADFVKEAALNRANSLSDQTHSLLTTAQTLIKLFRNFENPDNSDQVLKFANSFRNILFVAKVEKNSGKNVKTKGIPAVKILHLWPTNYLKSHPIINANALNSIGPQYLFDESSIQGREKSIYSIEHILNAPALVYAERIDLSDQYYLVGIDLGNIAQQFSNDFLFQNHLIGLSGESLISKGKKNRPYQNFLSYIFSTGESSGGRIMEDLSAQDHIVGFSKIKDLGILTISHISTKTAFDAKREFYKKSVLITIFFLSIALFLFILTTQGLGRRILRLKDILSEMGSGNYTLTTLTPIGMDEITLLEEEVAQAQKNIQKVIEEKLTYLFNKNKAEKEKEIGKTYLDIFPVYESATYPKMDTVGTLRAGNTYQGTFSFQIVGASTILVVMGQITEQSVAAAITAGMLRAIFEVIMKIPDIDLAQIVLLSNQTIVGITKGHVSFPLFLGLFDNQQGKLSFLNFKAPPPVLFASSTPNALQVVEEQQASLFGAANTVESMKIASLPFKSDDCLFLYAKGLLEVTSENGRPLGQKGVFSLLVGNFKKYPGLNDFHLAFKSGVQQFQGRTQLANDFSYLLIKFHA